MRKRVPIRWNATLGYHVDLPTYTMVPKSWLGMKHGNVTVDGVNAKAKNHAELAPLLTVEVDIPDEYCNPDTGAIEAARIRKHHRGNPDWCHTKRDWSWLKDAADVDAG